MDDYCLDVLDNLELIYRSGDQEDLYLVFFTERGKVRFLIRGPVSLKCNIA